MTSANLSPATALLKEHHPRLVVPMALAQTRGIAGSLLGADLSPEAKQAATDWDLSKSKLPKVTPKLMQEQSSRWGPTLEIYQRGVPDLQRKQQVLLLAAPTD